MNKALLSAIFLCCAAVAQAEQYIPFHRETLSDTPWATFHFQTSAVTRLKSDFTNTGTGAEAGLVVLYDKNAPSLGLFFGYFPVEDRFADLDYVLIPITLRASYDMQMTEGGVYFTMAAEGGGAINSFKDVVPQQSDVRNSYVIGGQAGFKFIPNGGGPSVLLVLGYQYLNPEVIFAIPGGYADENRNLGAPYIKLGLEF